MGFRIVYQSVQKKTGGTYTWIRLPVLILICLVLFFVIVEAVWDNGAAVLNRVLMLPNSILPVSALNCFAEDLREGSSLVSSFAHFCREMLP